MPLHEKLCNVTIMKGSEGKMGSCELQSPHITWWELEGKEMSSILGRI